MDNAQTLVRDIEKEIQRVKDNVLTLNYEVDSLREKAKDLEMLLNKISDAKVDKIEFSPVKSLVYGAVGLLLTLLLAAIAALVLNK